MSKFSGGKFNGGGNKGGGADRGPRKTVTLGDVCLQLDENGSEKKDKQGRVQYALKVYIPDDVGQIVLKNGDYINFRQLTEAEVAEMPDWKQKIAQLKAWIGLK